MKPTWQKKIINGVEVAAPFDLPSRDWFSEFKENQLLTGPLSGTRKPRSVKQLQRYWVMCKIVSENSSDPKLSRYQLVDWHIRHTLKFYDPDKVCVNPDGHVQFEVRSIAFRNLKHIEACDYFDRADQVMADMLKVTVEEMEERWGKQ